MHILTYLLYIKFYMLFIRNGLIKNSLHKWESKIDLKRNY